jgi:hypothetical protein
MRLGMSVLLLGICAVFCSASSCFGENVLVKPGTRKVSTLDLSLVNETSNVEFAALAAPRPQLLISCGGDWTKEYTPGDIFINLLNMRA